MPFKFSRLFAVLTVAIMAFETSGKQIVVVGGGLAGLTTAYELQKTLREKGLSEKHSVQVYEARDRVGGRVFTVKLNGRPVELGGENINDGGDAVEFRRVAKELGLQIETRQVAPSRMVFFDSVSQKNYTTAELKPFFPKITKGELKAALREAEKKSRNIAQVLDHFFKKYPAKKPEEKEKRLVIRRVVEEAMQSYEGGVSTQLSSRYSEGSLIWMLGGFLLEHEPKSYSVDSVAGGNSELALALAKKLEGKIRLNRPLVAIKKSKTGSFELQFGKEADVSDVTADIVVLAIPAKPYKDIQFGPGTLTPYRVKQIQSVSYGTHAKILVPAKAQTEARTFQTQGLMVWQHPGEAWLTYYFSNAAGVMKSDEDLLRGYEMGVQNFKDLVGLQPNPKIVVPDTLLKDYFQPVAKSWAADPFSQGSYSYYSPDLKDQLENPMNMGQERVLPLFAPVLGRIFFAGEHTTINQDIRGTMEAAVDSGVRAARHVLHALK